MTTENFPESFEEGIQISPEQFEIITQISQDLIISDNGNRVRLYGPGSAESVTALSQVCRYIEPDTETVRSDPLERKTIVFRMGLNFGMAVGKVVFVDAQDTSIACKNFQQSVKQTASCAELPEYQNVENAANLISNTGAHGLYKIPGLQTIIEDYVSARTPDALLQVFIKNGIGLGLELCFQTQMAAMEEKIKEDSIKMEELLKRFSSLTIEQLTTEYYEYFPIQE